MATQPTSGLTYDDLQRFPDDGLRREIIDGELFVTPGPGYGHQRVVSILDHKLRTYSEAHGGEVLPGPYDIRLSETTVVEPDIIFVRADRVNLFRERYLPEPPDLVVEVSSPSTRARDLTLKRAAFERFGVPEYWFVDLPQDRVLVFRSGAYGEPEVVGRGETLRSSAVPGFELPIDDLLG